MFDGPRLLLCLHIERREMLLVAKEGDNGCVF